MKTMIFCLNCLEEFPFRKIKSRRHGGQKDNTFHCPECASVNLKQIDLKKKGRAA